MRDRLLSFFTLLCLTGFALFLDAAPIIRDMCNQTSGDGMGHSCPSDDYLLIRPRYEDGTCGDWMCCPPNPDGKTYDCSHPVNPTKSGIGALKGLLAPRANAINPSTDTQTYPTGFKDKGAQAQNRVSRYIQKSVTGPKLKECWSHLQGKGAIATDLTYRKSANNWAFDKLRVTKSSLAKGQDEIAQKCIENSVRATSFPVEPSESVENAANEFVIRLIWPAPLPAEGTQMSSNQIALMIGSSGGLGDIAGCSECVRRYEYPYGLKCESRTSGGHLDCREHDTNVCSTAPTACLRGFFSGNGFIMY